MYRVYHLTRFVKSFSNRDAALEFVYSKRVPEDYEILDKSDFQTCQARVMSDPSAKVYLMKIIFEILSPRPSATNYATFSTLADAKAALADPTRFPEMQGYRIFQFLYQEARALAANTLTLRYKNVTPPWYAMANQRKGNPMTNFLAQATKIQSFGYFAIAGDEPAMMCATSPLETYAAPDWDSLAHYAANYDLCECGWHQPARPGSRYQNVI